MRPGCTVRVPCDRRVRRVEGDGASALDCRARCVEGDGAELLPIVVLGSATCAFHGTPLVLVAQWRWAVLSSRRRPCANSDIGAAWRGDRGTHAYRVAKDGCCRRYAPARPPSLARSRRRCDSAGGNPLPFLPLPPLPTHRQTLPNANKRGMVMAAPGTGRGRGRDGAVPVCATSRCSRVPGHAAPHLTRWPKRRWQSA